MQNQLRELRALLTKNAADGNARTVPPWPWLRTLGWSLALLISLLLFGPNMIAAFRPPSGTGADFLQEWLSARDYWNGGPVYSPLAEALFRQTGQPAPPGFLPWNAHPPVAVLLTLPFGWLGYADAHLLWNVMTVPLFLLAIAVVVSELNFPFRWLSLIPTLCLLVACYPLYDQIVQGQWNCVLAGLLIVTWWAARRGLPALAGWALGTAAAIKLFPGFLFVIFLLRGEFRAVLIGVLVAVAWNLLAMLVLGGDAFSTYITQVIPALEVYRGFWQNLALEGWIRRVFGLDSTGRSLPIWQAPSVVAAGLLLGLRLLITAVVIHAAWQSRRTGDIDKAFAVSILGLLLISPITWSHYLLLALQPLAVLWMRLPFGWPRWLYRIVLIVFWLPTYYWPSLVVGPEQTRAMLSNFHEPFRPAIHLTLVSIPFYALMVALILANAVGDCEHGSAARSAEQFES